MNEAAKVAARQLARRVMERERNLDNEIAENAALTLEMLSARREFRAGVEFNQEPLMLVARRQVRLMEARQEGAALHDELKRMATALFGEDDASELGCGRGCGFLGSARQAMRLAAT